MKKLFTFLFIALGLGSNLIAHANNQISLSASKHFGDERDVKNFHGVAAGGPITVIITLGSKESCRFEGDKEAISTLITEVKENILIIRPENSWKSWSKKYENVKIVAYVTAKSLTNLTMSGNGSITVNGSIQAKSFVATLSGSGSIKANVDTRDFSGVISGSGSLLFTGGAVDADIVISGSGNFNGKGFTVSDLSTTISGSGGVNIKADRKIEATISGSGNVNYSGNATVEKTVIGSGKVRKI
ncbi:head GIN domain-containing protein [Pedobacter sp. AW1-32]|uniref:head GIN domain-containing protein n=1 Tax=Pedobacter sp. AW1-32 TaxID=3383026 RepID=UPI003FF09D82